MFREHENSRRLLCSNSSTLRDSMTLFWFTCLLGRLILICAYEHERDLVKALSLGDLNPMGAIAAAKAHNQRTQSFEDGCKKHFSKIVKDYLAQEHSPSCEAWNRILVYAPVINFRALPLFQSSLSQINFCYDYSRSWFLAEFNGDIDETVGR